jgi:hypothetical protein
LEQDASATPSVSALARSDASATPPDSALARLDAVAGSADSTLAWSDAGADGMPREPAPTMPGSIPSAAQLGPQRYKVQFEASEEYVELVEKAKALLSQTAPRVDLGELHLRALRALVTELERKKYAATGRPRQRVAPTAATQSATPSVAEPAQQANSPEATRPSRAMISNLAPSSSTDPSTRSSAPARQTCAAALRRSVFERD